MIALTGPSNDALAATTLSRRSTSVTMPSPSRVRTRIAERSLAAMTPAASATVVSGSQNSGAPCKRERTVRVRTSGRARAVRAAWMSRARSVLATNTTPSVRLSTSSASSPGMQ
jgi:hypothetical protein